jgi:hypothetical protein
MRSYSESWQKAAKDKNDIKHLENSVGKQNEKKRIEQEQAIFWKKEKSENIKRKLSKI